MTRHILLTMLAGSLLVASAAQAAVFNDTFESYAVGATVNSLADWVTFNYGNNNADSAIAVQGGSNALDPPAGQVRHRIENATITLANGSDFSASMRINIAATANAAGLIAMYQNNTNYYFFIWDRYGATNSNQLRVEKYVNAANATSPTSTVNISGTFLDAVVPASNILTLTVDYAAASDTFTVRALDGATVLASGAWTDSAFTSGDFGVGVRFSNVAWVDDLTISAQGDAADLVAPLVGENKAAPVTLSWKAGIGVQGPATILNYYLYLDPNQLLFPMPDPNRGDAGGLRTLEDVQVSPPGGDTLGQVNYVWNGPILDDKKYYWAVDSIVQRTMSPTDPNLVVTRAAGNVWWFQGPATIPGLTGPTDVYVMPDLTKHRWSDDPNALFTVNITNFGKPVNKVEWYKVGTPDTLLTPGAKYEIVSTNTVTKLTVHNVNRSTAMTDNGYYYVKVWLDVNGSPASQPGVSAQAYLRASVDTGVPALRHRYSFSEVAGTTATDSISAKNGTIKVKSPPEGGTYAWGGGQLTLDNESPVVGDNDNDPNGAYVDLPNGMISALRENCTFIIWYTWQDPNYNDSSSIYQRVWDFGSSAPTGGEDKTGPAASCVFVRLATKNTQADNQIQFQSSRAGAAQDLNDGPVVWNQQVCVAVVRDGAANQWRMYVNGVQSPTTALTPTYTLTSLNDVNNWIGRCQQNNRGFYTGKLNEFRIYDMPLTAPWIKAAYDEGPDDIDLDPCLYPSTKDINGDCRVTLVELKDFVAHWLHCGLLSCNP